MSTVYSAHCTFPPLLCQAPAVGPGYGRSVEEESARAPPPWAGTLKRVSQSTSVGGPRTAAFYQNEANAAQAATGEQRKVPFLFICTRLAHMRSFQTVQSNCTV